MDLTTLPTNPEFMNYAITVAGGAAIVGSVLFTWVKGLKYHFQYKHLKRLGNEKV